MKMLLALPLRMLAAAALRVSKSSAPIERDGGLGGTAGLAKLQSMGGRVGGRRELRGSGVEPE